MVRVDSKYFTLGSIFQSSNGGCILLSVTGLQRASAWVIVEKIARYLTEGSAWPSLSLRNDTLLISEMVS